MKKIAEEFLTTIREEINNQKTWEFDSYNVVACGVYENEMTTVMHSRRDKKTIILTMTAEAVEGVPTL